jgi:hypothetical protein
MTKAHNKEGSALVDAKLSQQQYRGCLTASLLALEASDRPSRKAPIGDGVGFHSLLLLERRSSARWYYRARSSTTLLGATSQLARPEIDTPEYDSVFRWRYILLS